MRVDTSKSKPNRVGIREASERDIDGMAALLQTMFASDAAARPSTFATAGKKECVEDISERMKQGHRYFVAILEDNIAGMLSLEEVRRPERTGRQAENYVMIHLVMVEKSHRRQGIGSRLLRHSHEWAKEGGFDAVLLHVWEFNEVATRVYESLGYSVLGRVMAIEL